MRIAIQPPTGGAYWLAGQAGVSERDFSSVSDFRKSAEIVVQESTRVRAVARTLFDRANLKTTLSFGTVRKFATVAEAEVWALDYDRVFPRAGILIMESVQPVAGVVRRFLQNAVVRPPTIVVTGVSVSLQYIIEGGKITNS